MSTPVKSDDADNMADGKPIPQPTLPEAYFMLNIIKFINGKLDTDWAKVAEAQGLKNAETAKVRFGQIKKKLGFTGTTPASARARPPKRPAAAETDESGTTPAEKKPRKANAPPKSRAKKQQPAAAGGSSAPASSPTVVEDDSPLAAKSAKKAHHRNVAPIPSGLNHGNSYAVSPATGSSGNGYSPAVSAPDGAATMAVDTASKTIIKPERADSSDGDEESSGRTKASILTQIAQNQKTTGPESQPQRIRHPLPSGAPSAFGPPNAFPHVNMLAPLDAQQVQATAIRHQQHHHRQGQSSQSARQVRNAAARQAIASTQGQGRAQSHAHGPAGRGGGGVTTIQAHHEQHHGAHHGGAQGTQHASGGSGNNNNDHAATYGAANDDKDMALASSGGFYPPANVHDDADADDGMSAFHASMYGVGGEDGHFFG